MAKFLKLQDRFVKLKNLSYHFSLDKVSKNAYNKFDNPNEIFQLRLLENIVSFVLFSIFFFKFVYFLFLGGLGLY